MKTWIAKATMGLVCMLALACGKKAEQAAVERSMEKQIEKQTGQKADVKIGDNRVSMKSKDGEMQYSESGDLSLPKDFDKDILIPKDAKIQTSLTQEKTRQIVMQVKQSKDELTKQYTEFQTKQGWKEESSFNSGDSSMLSYEKPDRTLLISVAKDGDQSTISLTIEKKDSGS